MRMSNLLHKFSDAAIAVSETGTIVKSNESAWDLLGVPGAQSVDGEDFFELLKPKDVFGNPMPRGDFPFVELLEQGQAPNPFQFHLEKADGGWQKVSAGVVLVLEPERDRSHIVFVIRPLFRRRRADEAIDRILRMPAVRGQLVDRLQNREETEGPCLTRRQTEVLRMLAEGMSNAGMAERLALSEHTVRSHVQNLFRRLGVHSKSEAVARAFRQGLI